MEDFESGRAPEVGGEGLTIEEQAKQQQVPPSILAAVMQFKHWARGKKVSEEEFQDAVHTFLGSPISRYKALDKEEV
jgi:hypothetical protein